MYQYRILQALWHLNRRSMLIQQAYTKPADLRQQKLSRNLHLSRVLREVAEKSTLFLDEERLRQQFDASLKNLDPLFQLADEVVQLRRAGNTEQKI